MMAEGRSKAEWARLSSLLCMIANVNRDPKRRSEPYQPTDFDPFAPKKPQKRMSVTDLAVWMGIPWQPTQTISGPAAPRSN